MSRWLVATVRGLVAGGFLLLLCGPATAACPTPPTQSPLQPGELGLFFDAAGTISCADPAVFTHTTVYLVTRVPEGGIAEYKLPHLQQDSAVATADFPVTLPDPSAYLAFQVADDCNFASRQDTETCPVAPGEIQVLATYQVLRLGTGTVEFKLECPTFAGPAEITPVYWRCDTGLPLEFTKGEYLRVTFGSPTVETKPLSLGTVKARF